MCSEKRLLREVTADVSRCVGEGVGCVGKEQEESEKLFFFFWSKSHPYNKHFLSLYAVPDTIFLAGVKERHTPAFREFAYLGADRH